MDKHKWIHFKFPHNFFPQYDGNSYELIVYVDEHDQFYFFGNGILWCLGYDEPHVHLQRLVRVNEQHKIDLGSGIFLDEKTVRQIIKDRLQFTKHPNHRAFRDWFDNYLSICKGANPSNDCPRY